VSVRRKLVILGFLHYVFFNFLMPFSQINFVSLTIGGLRRKPTQKGILGPTLAERLTMAYMKKV
jgi:hypothetical protein